MGIKMRTRKNITVFSSSKYYHAKGIEIISFQSFGTCFGSDNTFFVVLDDKIRIMNVEDRKVVYEREIDYSILTIGWHDGVYYIFGTDVNYSGEDFPVALFIIEAIDERGKFIGRIKIDDLLQLIEDKLRSMNPSNPSINQVLKTIQKYRDSFWTEWTTEVYFTMIDGKPSFILSFYHANLGEVFKTQFIFLLTLDFNKKTVDVEYIYNYMNIDKNPSATYGVTYKDNLYLIDFDEIDGSPAIFVDRINITSKTVSRHYIRFEDENDQPHKLKISAKIYTNKGKPYIVVFLEKNYKTKRNEDKYIDEVYIFSLEKEPRLVKHSILDRKYYTDLGFKLLPNLLILADTNDAIVYMKSGLVTKQNMEVYLVGTSFIKIDFELKRLFNDKSASEDHKISKLIYSALLKAAKNNNFSINNCEDIRFLLIGLQSVVRLLVYRPYFIGAECFKTVFY